MLIPAWSNCAQNRAYLSEATFSGLTLDKQSWAYTIKTLQIRNKLVCLFVKVSVFVH
jgi:hypothetical protein